MTDRLGILFCGMIAGDPRQGGAAWAVLQYLLGLRRLGHEVWFAEPVAAEKLGSPHTDYIGGVAERFGFDDRWWLVELGGRRTAGRPHEELVDLARRADLLLNVSGMLTDEAVLGAVPTRAYLDLDPAFNQLWQAAEGIDMRFAAHTHHVTVGLALGSPECAVPTLGYDWIPTLPPVVLDEWRVADGPGEGFTTVANWRGYGSIDHDGVHYGQKAHSLRRLLGVPRRTGQEFVVALNIHPDERSDLKALAAHGWQLVDPGQVAGTPDAYRSFVAGSLAEFGVAKSGYVASRSGWFSDRSACYLASGRPVIAQDTGLARRLPTGDGLLVFTAEDDAADAVAAVVADYPRHRKAARELAEGHLDSDLVLGSMLERLGSAS